jgi:hypothetical protein
MLHHRNDADVSQLLGRPGRQVITQTINFLGLIGGLALVANMEPEVMQ